MIAPAKLLCSECQHENEPERVYCHNCGGRLDRAVAIFPTKEKRNETHKRVQRMFDAKRAKIRATFFKTCRTIIGAGVVAILFQVASAPDLPAPTKDLVMPSEVRTQMERAINRHQPANIDLSENEINAYLMQALKNKKTSLDKPFLDFQRAVANVREGSFGLTAERSIFGYSIFTGGRYSAAIKNGKLEVVPIAGSIGRLPIPPAVAAYTGVLFADIWKVLDPEYKLISKFNAIQIHDKRISFCVLAAN